MTTKTTLLLVGCGKMGGALLQRMSTHIKACVIDPAPLPPNLSSLPDILALPSANKIPKDFEPAIVILAIKPQYMAEALPFYGRFKKSVFLSIAAGLSLAKLEALLKGNSKETYSIVRSMPNLPASIGEGISVAIKNKKVTKEQSDLCEYFLKAVGKLAWVEDEKLIDAVTALSGSGPGYIFALCEAMAKAGVDLGLEPKLADELARQTIIGSGALLKHSEESAETLRIAVTSRGGTTEAALEKLMGQAGFPTLLREAMKAAYARARELAKLS